MTQGIRTLSFWTAAFFMVGLCSPTWAQQLTVRTLEQEEGRVRYELTARWDVPLQAALDTAGVTAFDINAFYAVSDGEVDASQLLELPARRVPIVQVTASDYEEVRLPRGNVPTDVMERFAAPAAQVVGLGTMRKRPVATLLMALVRYDAERQTLRRYRRLEVDVRFSEQDVDRRAAPPTARVRGHDSPHLAVEQSVLADGLVFKFPVTEEGLYRIDRSVLVELLDGTGRSPDDLEPNRLKIYGNGGEPLPALNSAPRPADLVENPVFVRGGGDGSFNEGDVLFFYANGPTGWRYQINEENPEASHWAHYVHPFSNANYYFLKVDGEEGRRVGEGTYPNYAGAERIEQVTGRHVVDFEDFNWHTEAHGTGLTWTSKLIVPGERLPILQDVRPPGLRGGTVTYEVRVAVNANPQAATLFESNGERLAAVYAPRMRGGELPPSAFAQQEAFAQSVSDGQALNLAMTLESKPNDPKAALDWTRVFYPRLLQATGGYLRFATPVGKAGRLELVLRGFDQLPQVWDITEPGTVRRLGVKENGSSYLVQMDVADPQRPRELVAFVESAARTLEAASAQRVAPQDLHGITSYPAFVIVAPQPFLQVANELAERRREQGLTVAVVERDQIYNEFSGGAPDMRAVRDYFKFMYDRGPDPAAPAFRYALLFGDGHYNYRNLGTNEKMLENWIFPYQTEETFDADASYTSDDYFGLLDDEEGRWRYAGFGSASPAGEPTERVDIGIGRFPVQTVEEAQVVLEKMRRYESGSTYGPWRSRYVFVADDGSNGLSGENTDGDLHVKNAEAAVRVVQQEAPALNVEKVYALSYPRVFMNGWRIPQAKQDLIAAINEGILAFNYSGHGGPTGLAQERIFTTEDAYSLTNRDQLPIFITATCSFGRWDMQNEQSGAEALLLNPGGGGVAIFTTVRLVYTSYSDFSLNPGLNRELNNALLTREPDGQPRRLGDIMRITKNTGVGLVGNSRKFNLLGDPTLRAGLPRYQVRVTSVNDVPVDSSRQARLRALERTRIVGEVQTLDGQVLSSFNGRASLTIYDAERAVTMPYRVHMSTDDYTIREDLIWRGDVDVVGGRFASEFVVPKDISYKNEPGRISIYAHQGDQDALGYSEDAIVGGTATNPPQDNQGPRVELFLNDTTFVAGGLTPPDPKLIVKLYDASGINAVGAGVGHEMLLTVDGNQQNAVNLGGRFTSEQNSYQRGRVTYSLAEYPATLEPGPHRLTVKAWDVLNNSSESQLDFYVSASEDLELRNVYNYPNPTTGPTRFIFEHNQAQGTNADVQIRIYTLSGHPIRTLEGMETLPTGVLQAGPVQVAWDGIDEDGDLLATGVYLYKVRVETEAPDGTHSVSERIERLAVIR